MDNGKIEKNNFLLQNDKFSSREVRLGGNMYYSYTERLALAKVEKVFFFTKK